MVRKVLAVVLLFGVVIAAGCTDTDAEDSSLADDVPTEEELSEDIFLINETYPTEWGQWSGAGDRLLYMDNKKQRLVVFESGQQVQCIENFDYWKVLLSPEAQRFAAVEWNEDLGKGYVDLYDLETFEYTRVLETENKIICPIRWDGDYLYCGVKTPDMDGCPRKLYRINMIEPNGIELVWDYTDTMYWVSDVWQGKILYEDIATYTINILDLETQDVQSIPLPECPHELLDSASGFRFAGSAIFGYIVDDGYKVFCHSDGETQILVNGMLVEAYDGGFVYRVYPEDSPSACYLRLIK